jgi:hypothetical protein
MARAALPPLSEAERLSEAATAARENNETTQLMDGLNRHWLVGTANADNHSHVLIQVRRGEAIRETYLRTDTFTPEAAVAAINDLHGALP